MTSHTATGREDVLDMGIWSDDGTVWLPKALYPTRSHAKKFAVENFSATYIDVRVRTRWVRYEPSAPPEIAYEICAANAPDAFECWEIT